MTAHLDHPFKGPVNVTQEFGVTDVAMEPAGYLFPDGSISYFQSGPGAVLYGHLHCGVDYGLVYGTQLYAPADGTVNYAAEDTMGPGGSDSGFGLCLQINHGDITTLYGHLDQIQVKVGQKVTRGQPIALSGGAPQYPGDWREGRSNGSHLHWSVIRNGDRHWVSPVPYVTAPTPTPPPPPKPRPPQPPNRYHPVAFTVTADNDGHPVNTFAGPSHAAHCTGTVPGGSTIHAVGWILGDAAWDPTAPNGGQWDCRWLLTDAFQWVASARVQGNPPNSTPQ